VARATDTYGRIFKSTFILGSVQVVNILAKVGLNKVAALLLGPQGLGLIGMFQSLVNILRTGFDLGLSQSVVRDISEANAAGDRARMGTTLATVKRLIMLTASLGALATIAAAPWLGRITFGSGQYTLPLMWTGLVVFMNILSESQLAIIKGMRHLKALARISLWGSAAGLLLGIPCYLLLREEGIVPALMVTAATTLVLSWRYVARLDVEKERVTTPAAIERGRGMIVMGIALMYVNFLVVVSDYIVRIFINQMSNMEVVGLFQAGVTVTSSYFGIVLTAMTTDYYPRISAIHGDNPALATELNRQVDVALLMVGVLAVAFVFCSKLAIRFLYTESFLPVSDYLNYAVVGVLFTACSGAVGMILLAKQATRVFFITSTVGRVVITALSIAGFWFGGLKGLGIAALLSGVFHLGFMTAVVKCKYKIALDRSQFGRLALFVLFAASAIVCERIGNPWVRIPLSLFIMGVVAVYAWRRAEKTMGLNLVEALKSKLKI
jgi:PST family polysaccharide transporter